MIDWKSRISGSGKYIDMQGLPYYHIKFGKKSRQVKIYEYDVWLPEEPPDEHVVNYGLPIKDQIFRRTYRPKQVMNPEKDWGREAWTQRDVESFIDAEWNRRTQGIWMYIKGEKTYIPGLLYMKMNYWSPITNVEFIYKFSDWELFMFWMHCLYTPSCKGIADFKCRQIGDTESVLLIMWEYGSRVRGTINAIQSCINEGHAIKTYKRLVHGHKKMVYYFRPLNQGTEDPKKGLNLSYPAQHITHKEVQARNKRGEMANRSSVEDYEFPEIGSQFYYGPSKANEFDGTTLGRAYLDEFGKAVSLNPVEWIQVIIEAIFSNITGKKMGMILMTSTVEEITADSLQWAQTIWRESDPAKLTSDGSTTNGLFRCFRNVVDRGEVDHWGFPLKEKIIAQVKEKYKAMIEAGNTRGAISFMRKNPITIEDVFMSAGNESQFHVENLQKRDHYLNEQAHPKPWVRGNFKWQDGLKHTGAVIWEPNPNGRWIVSKHPHDYGLQNNARVKTLFSPKPDNTFYFCAGVDPIDQSDTLDSEPSKGAICVMRRPDPNVDDDPNLYYQFNDDIRGIKKGMPVNLGENFLTNRVLCTYMDRPQNTEEFFEDVMLTMIYYGTDFLPEKNKFGGLHQYMKTHDYELYLMDKPTSVKNAKGQSEKDGVTATENSINMYFDFITTYTCNMTNAIDHPDLVLQLLTMNWKNKTKRDLGVAFGWCLYASMQQVSRRRAETSESKIIHFTKNTV